MIVQCSLNVIAAGIYIQAESRLRETPTQPSRTQSGLNGHPCSHGVVPSAHTLTRRRSGCCAAAFRAAASAAAEQGAALSCGCGAAKSTRVMWNAEGSEAPTKAASSEPHAVLGSACRAGVTRLQAHHLPGDMPRHRVVWPRHGKSCHARTHSQGQKACSILCVKLRPRLQDVPQAVAAGAIGPQPHVHLHQQAPAGHQGRLRRGRLPARRVLARRLARLALTRCRAPRLRRRGWLPGLRTSGGGCGVG